MACLQNHFLESMGLTMDNGWGCDGIKAPGGCRSGLTGFNQSQGMKRFRCKTCDYDLCEECYLERLNSRRCPKGHVLAPLGIQRQSRPGWHCDGENEGGCKSIARGFESTKTLNRFRCEQCDYDLCERCYETPLAKPCDRGHAMTLLGLARDNGWGCDGRSQPGGCKRGITGFRQTKGIHRFRCEACDFDLCDLCYEARPVADRGPAAKPMTVNPELVPGYWDMEVMEDIEMLKGLAPEEENVLNKFGKVELTESELASIQQIFDASHKKVYTRDRKGTKVPDKLLVKCAYRIQNLQNWTEFVRKQSSIRAQIDSLKETGNKGVCRNGHELSPLGTSKDNGWACDGRDEDAGCASKITGFRQTKGMNRFRCERCDFDYCEKCYFLRTGAKLCLKGHPLVPLGTTRDNGWSCDNSRMSIGCMRENKTKGINRYRCEQCDFDLCDLCFQRHIGHVNNNIENLKTSSVELHSEGSDPETNTVWLFHGTNDEAAEKITKGDFLVDKAGSNAGTLYGRGIYMAESCSKSDEYSKENSEGLRCMLICRAVLGNVLYCDEVAPNVDSLVRQCLHGNYHSLLGDREKCRGTFREFIVYDDDQVYPEIAVWYERLYES